MLKITKFPVWTTVHGHWKQPIKNPSIFELQNTARSLTYQATTSSKKKFKQTQLHNTQSLNDDDHGTKLFHAIIASLNNESTLYDDLTHLMINNKSPRRMPAHKLCFLLTKNSEAPVATPAEACCNVESQRCCSRSDAAQITPSSQLLAECPTSKCQKREGY